MASDRHHRLANCVVQRAQRLDGHEAANVEGEND